MTIEIKELVIQARVTSPEAVTSSPVATLSQLEYREQARLIDEITRAVLERLRDEQGRR
ncbi:DUF5908 family protein [Photorhabdus sp. RM71S]|uniref:DUF5908 family protein n=1 Tax=Photorhabdus sp. RM71S TaxID=3342824 RepID=UPI0036DC2170